PVLALSAPGGRKIITGTIMAIVNRVDFGMGVQAALDAPRLHCEGHDLDAMLEDGMPELVLDELRARGHNLDVTRMYQEPYGRMQSIAIDVDAGLYFGASEPRSHSGVRGY